MNTISSAGNNYLDMVQKATKRNTLSSVSQAQQSGQPLDTEQVQQSNQQIKDTARETGVELYSLNIQKQTVETYTNANNNNTSTDNNTDDDSSNVYTFDASSANETVQTAQQRAVGVAVYQNLSNQAEQSEFVKPSVSTYA